MGQQCQKTCYEPNLGTVQQASQNYLKIIQSVLVDEQFPIESVPKIVQEKIFLLNIKIDHKNSQLWKYEEPKSEVNDKPIAIYILINRNDITDPAEASPEPQKLIVTDSHPRIDSNDSPKVNIFNPYRFTEAAIFVFTLKDNPKDQANPYVDDSASKFQFQEFYFGPVNQKMSQPSATKIFKNGNHYQGNISNNLIEGQGIMANDQGNHSYNGTWSKNKPQGEGVEELDSKFKYEGKFSKGKWNGYGKLTIYKQKNQINLQGIFENGTLQGHGTIKNAADKLIYQGEFKNSKQHGKGKWYGSNNEYYEGDFIEGRKQGHGLYRFSSKSVYEGDFKNGIPQGRGMLRRDGKKIIGHWYNGQNIIVLEEVEENQSL